MSAASLCDVDWHAHLPHDRALDPYLIWADCTGFAATGPIDKNSTLPFLIEVPGGSLTQDDLPTPLRSAQVAAAYVKSKAKFQTAQIACRDIVALVESGDRVPRFQLSLARAGMQDPQRWTAPAPPAAALPKLIDDADADAYWHGARTVIGIIDDGCPFAHPNLADSSKRPRVRFLWDQGAVHGGRVPPAWKAPDGFVSGLEIKGSHLEQVCRSLPERRVYPALGFDRISGRARIHGNGIAHLAAGRRVPVDLGGRATATDAASDLPIVFVQLPLRTVADTTGGSIGFHVLDAMHYVNERALRLSGSTPDATSAPQVVINLSYGSFGGPHDGQSLVERALVDFSQSHPKVSLVVAAGNSPIRPVHVEFDLPSKSHRRINWSVGPDHPLESYLEVWWPESASLDDVEVELRAPGDVEPCAVATRGSMAFGPSSPPRCGIVFCRRVAQGTAGTMALIAVRPTRGPGAAQAGRWQVDVINRSRDPIGGVHAWVERNDLVLDRPRRQQGALMLPPVVPPARAAMMLASMSNIDPQAAFGIRYTLRYLVVGASRVFDLQCSDRSSAGPSLPTANSQGRAGPDGLAPAELGSAQSGLLVDGPFAGQWSRSSGSSAAAAIATRKLLAAFEIAAAGGRRPHTQPIGPWQVKVPATPDSDGWFRIEPARPA